MGYCHKHDEPFTIQCKGCKLDKLQTRLEQAERERDEWKELSISCQVATIKLADKYVKEIQAELTALRTRLEEAERELKHCLNLDNHNNIVRQKNEEIKSLEAENAALTRKLEEVRVLANRYIFGPFEGFEVKEPIIIMKKIDHKKLLEILDGEK